MTRKLKISSSFLQAIHDMQKDGATHWEHDWMLCRSIAKSLKFVEYVQSFAYYLNFAIRRLLRIYFSGNLFAINFPYKHSKFGATRSI